MTTQPVYPKNVLAWTDRRDEIDIVWSEDPNAIAAEVTAVENTLGAMPHLETNPIAGPQIQFVNVDQRLDYLTSGAHLPVAQLGSQGQKIANKQGAGTFYGVFNSYGTVVYDPYDLSNGSDVTVPVTGWYKVEAIQYWPWSVEGYAAMHLLIENALQDTDIWQWVFGQNEQTGLWQGGSDIARPGATKVHYHGIINQGGRIRVISENGTLVTPVTVTNMRLSVECIRVTDPDPKIIPVPIPVGTTPNPPSQVTRYPAPTAANFSGTNSPWKNLGNGNIELSWNRINSPVPVPASYTVAVYYTTGGLASYTTVSAPDTSGAEVVTVANLVTGRSYQAHIWANGGMIAPPHLSINLSI